MAPQNRATPVMDNDHFHQCALAARFFAWDQDVLGRYTFVSEEAEVILGYRAEEMLGRCYTEFFAPGREHPAFPPPREGLRFFRVVNRVAHKDGREVVIESSGKPLWTADGALLGYRGVDHDITDRWQTEAKLRLAAAVMENTDECVMVTDREGTILAVNPAFTAVTGYTAEEAVGQTPRIFKSGWHETEFYERVWQELKAAGHWQGEIVNRRKTGEVYAAWLTISAIPNDNGNSGRYITVFSDISGYKAQQEENLRYLSHYDPLTGLPNRLLFAERLKLGIATARRDRQPLAVLFMDLDRFKEVNDGFGHHVGDQLLQQVGKRLAGLVREGDTAARLSGDEFALILPGASSEGAVKVAAQMLKAFEVPFSIGEQEFFTSPSIGIAFCPHDGETPEELMKNADSAMYRAKQAGKNAYVLYNQEMNAELVRDLVTESRLRHALERSELFLLYQPQVDIRSGAIQRVEALLRWDYPGMGLIPPAQFIPLAEKSGAIVPIGAWVLDIACAQWKAWQAAGCPPVPLSVNLSPREFHRSDLADRIARILNETGLEPRFLELEFTEDVIARDAEAGIAALKRLKSLGVGLILDDFGTGYSSLLHLERLPVDAIKINQSFISTLLAKPETAAIVSAIITIARSFNMKVVAKGVESKDQLIFLQALHCDEIQGFYAHRPLSTDAMTQALLQPAKKGKRFVR